MSRKNSAGILLFRRKDGLQVLLVHPGGPFWKNKDSGAWSVPKGEYAENEEPLAAALREFEEETGLQLSGKFIELSPIRQKSGKTVHCWALEGDADPAQFKSNSFEMEWPPRSGKKQSFPEVDRAEWFPVPDALKKILEAKRNFLEELKSLI